MKDLEADNPTGRAKKETKEIEDEYLFTDDQRKATLELQTLYRKLGLDDFDDGFEEGFSAYDDPQYDIVGKLREANTKFNEDSTPLESGRNRKVRFKESVVDLVVPISPIRNGLDQEYDYLDDQEDYEDNYYGNYYGTDDFEKDDRLSDEEEIEQPVLNEELRSEPLEVENVNDTMQKNFEEHADVKDQKEPEDCGMPSMSDVTPEDDLNDRPLVEDERQSGGDNNVAVSELVVESDQDKIEAAITDELKNHEEETSVRAKTTKVKTRSESPQSAKEQMSNDRPKTRPSSVGNEIATNDKLRPTKPEKLLPTYKGNSRSKYGLCEELKRELRRLKHLEEYQKKAKEKDKEDERRKKREEAEVTFKAWLHQKKISEKGKFKENKGEVQNQVNQNKSTSDHEQAFLQWWEQKQNQLRKEKIIQKLQDEEKNGLTSKTRREQSKKEYRKWLKRKNFQRRHQLALQSHFLQLPSHISLPQAIQQAEMLKRTFQAYFGSSHR